MKNIKPIEKMYVMHSFEWFQDNGYQDSEADFWEVKEERDHWEKEESSANSNGDVVDFSDIGKTVERVAPNHWGVKLTITPETHPEYFL